MPVEVPQTVPLYRGDKIVVTMPFFDDDAGQVPTDLTVFGDTFRFGIALSADDTVTEFAFVSIDDGATGVDHILTFELAGATAAALVGPIFVWDCEAHFAAAPTDPTTLAFGRAKLILDVLK